MIIGSISENKDLEKRISITPEIAKNDIKTAIKYTYKNFKELKAYSKQFRSLQIYLY